MRLPNRKLTAAAAFARARRYSLIFAVVAVSGLASATPRSSPPPPTFEQAQHARQSLESRPEDQRTKRDYDRVLDLYRAIYHDDPASPKADASIFAVAQLLAEQGRVLQDEKSLRDAIGQYEFLRREYPGSRYRADALLAEGTIYLRDLNDNAAARTTLQLFVKQYPHSPLTAEAQKDLKELHTGEVAAKHPSSSTAPRSQPHRASPQGATPRPKHSNTVLTAAIQSQATEPTPPASVPATQSAVTATTPTSSVHPPPAATQASAAQLETGQQQDQRSPFFNRFIRNLHAAKATWCR